MEDSKPRTKPIALVDVTSALQLRISTVDLDGKVLDVGVSINRISAQHLARVLMEYSGVMPLKSTTDKRKTSFVAHFDPDYVERSVVHIGTPKRVR